MARTDWFENDRFGMFVHFGLYSGPAGIWKGKRMRHAYSEWLQASEKIPRSEYRKLAKQFNPIRFDADEWMRNVEEAGMKYFIITAKHHDGFALWPSKASKHNVMYATPFRRDILGELAAAAKRHGIRLGFYYSHWQDWEGTGGDICTVNMESDEYVHPTQRQFEDYWRNKALKAMGLETGQSVKVESGKQGVWLELPKELAGLSLPVIALDLKGKVNP